MNKAYEICKHILLVAFDIGDGDEADIAAAAASKALVDREVQLRREEADSVAQRAAVALTRKPAEPKARKTPPKKRIRGRKKHA